MFPSPCTSTKGSGSRQPGNCSALLPSSALFPQPFLAAHQPLAQRLFPVPSSSWRKVRGKGLASLCGFILKSPSLARATADHQNPTSSPWHAGLRPTRSYCDPLGPWQGTCSGAEPEQSKAPLPSPASLCDCSEPLHLRGERQHRQSRQQDTPRHRAKLSPSALGHATIWHQAALLCCKENIQIKQLTGFCSFPLSPIQTATGFQQPPSPSR